MKAIRIHEYGGLPAAPPRPGPELLEGRRLGKFVPGVPS